MKCFSEAVAALDQTLVDTPNAALPLYPASLRRALSPSVSHAR